MARKHDPPPQEQTARKRRLARELDEVEEGNVIDGNCFPCDSKRLKMTEEEGVRATDAQKLLAHLGDGASERKLRLFACACARRIWHLIDEESLRRGLDAAEQVADGRPAGAEFEQLRTDILSGHYVGACQSLCWAIAWQGAPSRELAAGAAEDSAIHLLHEELEKRWWSLPFEKRNTPTPEELQRYQAPEETHQANLLRDIIGNPYRRVCFSTAWRTDTAVTLARTMYEAREFSAMPILADALQDAGCEDEAILSHCRDANQSHVRGCWVVDLVLDKK